MTYVRETFVSLSAHHVAHLQAEICMSTPAVTISATDENGRRVVALALHSEDYETARIIAKAINDASSALEISRNIAKAVKTASAREQAA